MSESMYKTRAQERYNQVYRIILKSLGIWPYQQTCFVRLQQMFNTGVLVLFILAQSLVFITNQYDINLLLKIFSFLFPNLFATVNYVGFIVMADNLKILLDQIQNDWNLLKDKLEIDIIKKYACNMRLFAISVIVFCYLVMLSCGIFESIPLILDIILPLNESRPIKLMAMTEYFIDQEKYIYYLMLHESLTGYIGMLSLCGIGVILVMVCMHSCALFKIASYRIENVIDKSVLPRREYLLYQRIVHAVVMHQRAIEYLDFVNSIFATYFVILIIIGVSSFSINLFQLFQYIRYSNDIRITIISLVITMFHLTYMFTLNYPGQEMINQGLYFFKACYNNLWYVAPLHIQKLLLFIMQRGSIDTTFVIGKIYVGSFEGFATLMSTAISYFTVIYSTR
ncbi:putative odorant receptor 69a isoform X1 [Solenopsis invicta]|uniref:putative odorant receptor 69a isoform X1 n=1 Tax=Solenopsis invicta TaxID=13686 RepID=UPI00193E4C10|nr:putative odorant receptor 69a isoform X1 [Solenopsis invicta]